MAGNEDFGINLMRMIAAEMHLQNSLAVAREMFGKNYFALGVGEKQSVDQTVFASVAGNYQAITPEFLAGQQAQQPVGFVTPKVER